MDEHKYKRRRLDQDISGTNGNMTHPSQSNNIPAPAIGSAQYAANPYPPTSDTFARYAMSARSYWDDQAALEYLAAGDGFAHDMRLVVPPPFHFGTPSFTSAEIPPPVPNTNPARMIRNVPSANSYRPLPHDYFQQFPGGSLPDDPGRDFVQFGDSMQSRGHPDTISSPEDYHRLNQLVNLAANLHPPPLRQPPPRPSGPTTPQIILVLSRATQESIDALAEHKRECPACQLEFEPDNFMAVISCCDTAMHATCLSAWVNSQTYSKSKTCMKCRRAIDARRPLNTVIPPVSDKNWDEGADLNAPETVKGDRKIEIPVSARPDRTALRRHMRGSYAGYAARPGRIHIPDNLPPDAKRRLGELQTERSEELEGLKRRLRIAQVEHSSALEEDTIAQRRLGHARSSGNPSPADLEVLFRKCEESKEATTRLGQELHSVRRALDELTRTYERRMSALLGRASLEPTGQGEVTRSASTGEDQSSPSSSSSS